ncbi:unnamed protein product [Cercospora beticola]|nr:unnamed protein product [Cercospora beticola]
MQTFTTRSLLLTTLLWFLVALGAQAACPILCTCCTTNENPELGPGGVPYFGYQHTHPLYPDACQCVTGARGCVGPCLNP